MAILTPITLTQLASHIVLIRIWQRGRVLTIELVSSGRRVEPLPPLMYVHYEVDLPLSEDSPFLDIHPTISVEKMDEWTTEKVQAILDVWEKHSIDLCMNFDAFGCHILKSGSIVRIPKGRLDLVLHYVRLSSLLGARLESEYDDSLSTLLGRFNSFIQSQIKEFKRFGEILGAS